MTKDERKMLRDLASKSSCVVSWYPYSLGDGYHPGQASVRGPSGRWFLVTGGESGSMTGGLGEGVAELNDDARFAAAAMNNLVPLLDEIDRLEAFVSREVPAVNKGEKCE
jgi:hypothetical protein